MAGVSLPQPDKILDYPQNGELKYHFRKELTSSDLAGGLILTLMSSYHLRDLSTPLFNAIAGGGLKVWCYTPAVHHEVVLRCHGVTNFRFRKPGWDYIAIVNQFFVGQEIDFWSLYDAEDGPHGILSFLIQPVGDSGVPHEAASGGTATSS